MRAGVLALAALLAIPMALAGPVGCAGGCDIQATTLPGYTPAAVVVQSGASITWTSTDTAHIQVEGPVAGGGEPCFFVFSEGGGASEPVQFDVVDGIVTATVGETSTVCSTATAIGPSAAAVPYLCLLHPTMRGAVVVTA